MSGKPTVISTFAGCGGSSLGYKWAGFEELLAIEWDQNAVDTFEINFSSVPIWKRDMREVTGKEILEHTGLKPGELDVLDGSPPCQGFSTNGNRNMSDERNNLFYEYIRVINDLQPKVFVMENVSGMVKGKMKGKFKEIMIALKETGYNVKCKLMNSMYYDVPQSRQRLIWIGVKNGQPKYPGPNKKIITVKEAIKNCKKGKIYGGQRCLILYPYIKIGKNGSSVPNYIKNKHNYRAKLFNLIKLHPNKPSPTLLSTKGGAAGLLHWKEKRRLYVSELKRICSFPDDFQLIGSEDHKINRLGNAVMPKFMEHIARTIKEEIL